MSVFFDQNSRIFYLNSRGCTYAFGINSLGIPEHLYFGAPVGRDLFMGTYNDHGRIHPALRLFPKGLNPEFTYYCPELDKTMQGSSWMNWGILPAYPAGDFRTLVYHFHKV